MDRELNIICSTCQKPIGDTDEDRGYLWIRRDEVMDRQDAMRAWMSKYATSNGDGGHTIVTDGAGIMTHPKRVVWRAEHTACDSGDLDDMYNIPAFKLRTWADLVAWTAHLMAKSWLDDTNWANLLEAAASGSGSVVVPLVQPKLNAL